MNIIPTCRFCCGKLVSSYRGFPFTSDVFGDFAHYWCYSCKSEQIYREDASPIDWSFLVPPYMLYFWPGHNFTIFLMEGDYIGKPILTTKAVPVKMTPQNITIERVKLLILFS
jgi:hypothetical protein